MTEVVTGQLGAEGRFWEAMKEGHLELPRCSNCQKWYWPAVWRCGSCGSWDHEWVDHPLAGTIFTWTRTWHPFGGTEAFEKPFIIAIAALETAPIRLAGVIEGNDDGLTIGSRVTGHIDSTGFAGSQIPSFRWRLIA